MHCEETKGRVLGSLNAFFSLAALFGTSAVCSIVASISACHAESPGSIPGGGFQSYPSTPADTSARVQKPDKTVFVLPVRGVRGPASGVPTKFFRHISR